MSGVRVGTRLEHLVKLRTRVDHEIAAERRAAATGEPTQPQQRVDDLLVCVPLTLIPSSVVRDWAYDQGYRVGERGRLPHHVYLAYARAHQ